MTTKRRLPLLPSDAPSDAAPRPAWQWAGFGAGLLLLAWLLLSLLVAPLSNVILRRHVGSWASPEDLAAKIDAATPEHLSRLAVETAGLQLLVLGVAGFGAGWVVGTWGPRRGVLESAVAGALAAALAAMLAGVTSSSFGAAPAPASASERGRTDWASAASTAVVVAVGSASAALGARRGGRKKRVLSVVRGEDEP